MIAGVLVALVIGLLFCARQSSLFTARMVALTAVGISFGGSMTYGQTVGLTHDAELHGNWAALRWGMLGLFIIGAIWIGFAGLLLGAALGGKRYRALEMLLLFIFLIQLYFLGIWIFNEPFEPGNRQLPRIYFSDSWHWEPDKANLEPRAEVWGGLALALAALWLYVAVWKRDAMARNIGLFGVIFGGIGFATGQSVQAFHAWNSEWFQEGWFAAIEPYMNWWNTMETVFGAILGTGLGLGVWLNRTKLPPPAEDYVEIAPAAERVLLAGHVAALAAWNFMSFDALDGVADHALTMGLLPLALVVGGRYSPYLIALPISAMPICGKTLREMSYYHAEFPAAYGWATSSDFAAGSVDGGRPVVRAARRAQPEWAVVCAVEPADHELALLRAELCVLPLPVAVGRAHDTIAVGDRICGLRIRSYAGVRVLSQNAAPPAGGQARQAGNGGQQLNERARLRHGRTGKASAAYRSPIVLPPRVVIVVVESATYFAFAPDDVVSRIHFSVRIEVAGERIDKRHVLGHGPAEHARGVVVILVVGNSRLAGDECAVLCGNLWCRRLRPARRPHKSAQLIIDEVQLQDDIAQRVNFRNVDRCCYVLERAAKRDLQP